MAEEDRSNPHCEPSSPRREFLAQVSAAAAVGGLGVSRAVAAETAPAALPSVQLGPHRISRLIVGWNPIDGNSHSTRDLALTMREWFTHERIVALLEDCQHNGITTWQYDHMPKSVAALRKLWDKGVNLKVICLHAQRPGYDAPIKTVIADTKPIAMVHHGGVTERAFHAGKAHEVRDYVKKVKDQGILAGVSTHCPDTIKRVMDEGWENDFFMCSFYYLTRPREEMEKRLGKVPVGEPFFESDPLEMTAAIRQVSKPCLAFKLLAAGRLCWNRQSVEDAFKFAFANIKPTDAVIVGMFPRFSDQVRENAALVRKYAPATFEEKDHTMSMKHHATRREFLKGSATAAAALGVPGFILGSDSSTGTGSPNADVRIGIVGLGDVNGGVGGRGRQLINAIRDVPGARIVALCDVDSAHLDREAKRFKDRGEEVALYRDIRKLLDNKDIDAVVVATPNHWHALATVWACQAGKDVYVEKPLAYNIFEGRQMVAAARKYGRMVQVGTQSRSSPALQKAFEYLRSGQLGAIRSARAIVYRSRGGIGKVTAPTPVPATVDYDLWCGPSQKAPLMRKHLHYEWHWFWSTGNGEIGNNGIHVIDVCRWALGQSKPAPRAIAIGGRFGFDDCGETPNTMVTVLDYKPAPLICEVRNVQVSKDSIGTYRGRTGGVVIECEGGYFAGDAAGGTLYDAQGRKINDILKERLPEFPDAAHLANFVSAVRSRRVGDLHADVLEGHASTACCHMANISYRLGQRLAPQAILESIHGNADLSDAFERSRDYMQANGIKLAATQASLGPWVTLDGEHERFVGEFAEAANALAHRVYREPFVVPSV